MHHKEEVEKSEKDERIVDKEVDEVWSYNACDRVMCLTQRTAQQMQ